MKRGLKTEFEAECKTDGARFAIVVSRWHERLTSSLAAGAQNALVLRGASTDDINTFTVPGAFELPVACLRVCKTGDFDAVIALGVVIRGDTPHFEYVAGQAASGILQASMQTGVPVMFGVITADTLEQATARSGDDTDNKGYEAAISAVEMVNVFREMDRGNDIDKVISNVAG